LSRQVDDAVIAHLADRGFGGVIRVSSWADGAAVVTEVRQSDGQAVPWTGLTADWLVEALKELPGRSAVRRPVPGVIRVTWSGRR
jgi:hypothetical protein